MPVVERHVGGTDARGIDAGVVHQAVDATESRQHILDEAGDRIPFTDVAREPEDLGVGRGRDLLGDLVAELLFPAAHHDGSAGPGESFDHRPADALRGSGDDHHFAGEIEQLRGVTHVHRSPFGSALTTRSTPVGPDVISPAACWRILLDASREALGLPVLEQFLAA